jgi:type I restriction enzyme S subunit
MALTVPVAEIVKDSKNPLLGKHDAWGRVLLGDIAKIQNGFPFKSSQFTKDKGMPLIRIRDVGSDSTDTNYVGEYDPAFIVDAGDLLIGMDGDFNCARWRGPKGLLNQRVCRVILKSDIYHPKLLDYALPGYLKAINDMTSSVTVKHLSSKSIAEIPLPLPPMEQQKRIVAEIEKQFSRLEEAVANLKRVKANLNRYKAAVLKAAVEGRLVETEAELARREGRSYETGEQLLQRILEARRSQWKGKGKYKEPAAPDTTDLPELPEGWVWASLDQLSWGSGYGISAKCAYENEGLPVLRIPNVDKAAIDLTDVKYAPSDFSVGEGEALLPGDMLVIRTNGSKSLIGRAAIVTARFPQPTTYASYLIRFRLLDDESLSAWVLAYWQSHSSRLWIESKAATSAGQHNISMSVLATAPVPLPSVADQRRIVTEVHRRLSLLLETEAQVDANLQRSERLRQSVLSKAFSTLPTTT